MSISSILIFLYLSINYVSFDPTFISRERTVVDEEYADMLVLKCALISAKDLLLLYKIELRRLPHTYAPAHRNTYVHLIDRYYCRKDI